MAGAIKPTVEPEIAVLMGEDSHGPFRSMAEALAYIDSFVPAIDVVDSRFE